jgi:hypothetical protein
MWVMPDGARGATVVRIRCAKWRGSMSDQASQGRVQVNQGLVIGGAVLIGLAGVLGFAGVMLLSTAVVSATRRWLRQLERPPSETAKLRLQQIRAATSAGAEAWRSGSQQTR